MELYIIARIINLAKAWWMLDSINDIYDVEALHSDSPWTYPKYRVTFDPSVIWGLMDHVRLFGHNGSSYRNLV